MPLKRRALIIIKIKDCICFRIRGIYFFIFIINKEIYFYLNVGMIIIFGKNKYSFYFLANAELCMEIPIISYMTFN